MMILLQSGVLYEPFPGRLPIWLLVIGAALLVLGGMLTYTNQNPVFTNMTPLDWIAGVWFVAGGFLLTGLALLKSEFALYATFLFLLFRLLEGAALFRFYYKVSLWVRNQGGTGGTNTVAIAAHTAVMFSLSVILVGLVLHAIVPGVLSSRGLDFSDPRLLYTAVTVTMAVLGVHWRLRYVSNWPNKLLTTGFALSIAGAELFNFASAGQEILILVLGSGVYAVGFWVVFVLWSRGVYQPNSASNTP